MLYFNFSWLMLLTPANGKYLLSAAMAAVNVTFREINGLDVSVHYDIMNSFSKTEAAIFSMQTMLSEGYPLS